MKLVREHINFERGLNPKKAMGMGLESHLIKFIKDYNLEKIERKWLVYHVAKAGRTDLVQFLLNNNADPNYFVGAPISIAATKGYLDIIKLLAKHGANLDAENGQALNAAMANKHPDAFELLLQLGANPNEGFVWQNAAKHDAIYMKLIKKYNKGW